MITNGFTYIAVLIFIAAMLVWLQKYTKSKFFEFAPPIVLLYLMEWKLESKANQRPLVGAERAAG